MRTFVLLLIVLLFSNAQEIEMTPIIPAPQSAAMKNSRFKITSTTKIVLWSGQPSAHFIAQQINDELELMDAAPLKVTDEQSVRKLSSNYIFIGKPSTEYGKKFLAERKGKLMAEMKTEGYFLDVDAKGIAIIAESDKGLFYGTMSLLQLMKKEKRSVIVAGASIHDFPEQKIRGISDDVSRGQISTMENFKKIIRFCARYKLNVYSIYIEDIFTFKKHPQLGKNRGALTAAECRELDAYAKKYFVEVIPIFETLGHWENILLHPDYMKFAEFPGAHSLNVSDERVYVMLDEMVGEVASCFSSPYFNIGADESWDVGLGSNKERSVKEGLATVYAEHYKRVFEIVKKHGKKPMMYGDIILNNPDILKKIPPEVVVVDWQYHPVMDYSSPEIFKHAGFPFIVSPAIGNYNRPFPNYMNAIINIEQLNRDGYENKSLGILCSGWNDNGGGTFRELNYYGYAWNAECAWNPAKSNIAEFQEKFFKDFFGVRETDKLQSIYITLSNPVNQYYWYELWRHPMLALRESAPHERLLPALIRVESIKSSMPFVLSLIEDAKKEAATNADHLQYLVFIARLNLWFAKKIETQEKIKLFVNDTDSPMSAALLADTITGMCDEVASELSSLQSEYERLWQTTNRLPNLELMQKAFERQLSYWKEIAEQAKRKNFDFDSRIKSDWIYHPKANPFVKDSLQVQRAFFRKTFSLRKNVLSAKLQLLGDTWTKLYINGKLAGEVMARLSNSWTVEFQRAKIFDILPFLSDSENVITVESQNFQPNGSAGVNIYGEIIFADGSKQNIKTDSSWSVSEVIQNRWNKEEFNASSWMSAFPQNYPVLVVAPNLSAGRTSWFEQ